MRFMHALDIMSRNKDGTFQWTSQIIATLNAMGDLSVDETSTIDEILEAVSNLDVDSKSTLLYMKVTFRNDFDEIMEEEEQAIKKESQKIFYGFTVFVILGTAWMIFNGNDYGVEPETLNKFMELILGIMKLLFGVSGNG